MAKALSIIRLKYMPRWRNGIRGRLRACVLWTWRFESSPGQVENPLLKKWVFCLHAIVLSLYTAFVRLSTQEYGLHEQQ